MAISKKSNANAAGPVGSVKKPKKSPPSATTDLVGEPLKNWADDEESAAYQAALKLYPIVQKAYENVDERDNAIGEYWSIYNCQPDENQQYAGNSQGYIPAVRDAINARAKRALKQLFPENNKHVEAVSSDPTRPPYTQISLLEYYIRQTGLKSIVRSDLIAGDVTGQWNLMLDWTKTKRSVTKLVKKNPILTQMEGEDVSDLEIEDPLSEVEDTEEDEVIEEGPEITDFATEDLVVIPPTCNDLQKAKAVAIKLRLSPDAVRQMEDEGVFILPTDTDIDAFCRPEQHKDKKPPPKRVAKDAGVKTEGTYKYALIYMVYSKFDFGGEHKEEGIAYFAGPNEIVGLIKNPLWSGKRPIISQPVERLQGSFFGKSKIEPVKFLAWQLNDFHNMGQDSALYSMLPVFAADPLKNPNWASMTLGLAAVWPIAPEGIKTIEFPQIWKDAWQMVDTLKRQIWESMDVNEAMMGRVPGGRKNNALIGSMQQEQQINITDHASRYEEVVLNPLLEWLFELDQQYRTDELMVESRGEIGVKAAIEMIPVQQWMGERYFFRWLGTEFMQGMQRMQQQISTMNVLKGIPPQALGGKTVNIAPIIENIVENVFGAELGPKILEDKRNLFQVPPDMEDEMLHNGFDVPTHEGDDDPTHLQHHMKAAAMNGDPQMLYKKHMMEHMQQLMKKQQMQMAQQQKPGGLPGSPGGGPGTAPPMGAAGAPRPGAMPGPPRPGGQQPPGAIGPDQMMDPAVAGRG